MDASNSEMDSELAYSKHRPRKVIMDHAWGTRNQKPNQQTSQVARFKIVFRRKEMNRLKNSTKEWPLKQLNS
jgi:hypothetical protein